MTLVDHQGNAKKKLAAAWTRFASRISRVKRSALSLRQGLEKRRRQKELAAAWTRFADRMSRIRGAVVSLMREMEERRRAKDLDQARQRLQKL